MKEAEEDKQAYGVKIKSRYIYKGKKRKPERFKTVRYHPLSKYDAYSLGSHLVDRSTGASFTIFERSGKPKPLKLNVIPWEMSQHKFYPKGNILIERTAHRIDTQPEVEGIPWQGQLAQMEKAQLGTISHERSRATRQKAPSKVFSDFDIFKDINKMMKEMRNGFKRMVV